MDEEDPLEVLELSESEVCGPDGGPPLLARDAQPDVRLLDHGHVVGAVAHRGRHG